MLKSEKVYKCFAQDCLKIFLLGLTSLKMHWNPRNDQYLVDKSKFFSEVFPCCNWMRLVRNSYLTLKCKIVLCERYHIQAFFATELSQKSIWRANWHFQILKSLENVKSRGLHRLRNENLFSQAILEKKGWRQIHKIKQNRFFYGIFHSWLFLQFYTKKRQNQGFEWTAVYSLSHPSILGIFLNFPNLLRF